MNTSGLNTTNMVFSIAHEERAATMLYILLSHYTFIHIYIVINTHLVAIYYQYSYGDSVPFKQKYMINKIYVVRAR